MTLIIALSLLGFFHFASPERGPWFAPDVCAPRIKKLAAPKTYPIWFAIGRLAGRVRALLFG